MSVLGSGRVAPRASETAVVGAWQTIIPAPPTRDLYELHRAVMRGYPPKGGNRRAVNALWAEVPNDDVLLVRSSVPPVLGAWGNAPREFVAPPDGECRFTLTANASYRPQNGGNRRPHPDPTDWLAGKAAAHGFDIEWPELRILSVESRVGRKGKKPITVSLVTYTGILTVVDSLRFADVWLRGLGPARGLGAGLIHTETA